MLTEESDDDLSRLQRNRVWIVDPLDGTSEYISGTGEFVVQIALAVRGDPWLGVIYHPVSGLLYRAVKGHGAFRIQEGRATRLAVSAVDAPSQMRMAASRSHYSDRIDAARLALGIETVERVGSVGLKVGLVAQGLCDLYLSTTVAKEWDVCAPHAILSESGGVLTSLSGEVLVYNRPDVISCRGLIASNGRAHKPIVDAVSALVD